jgi:hypothetical protein
MSNFKELWKEFEQYSGTQTRKCSKSVKEKINLIS